MILIDSAEQRCPKIPEDRDVGEGPCPWCGSDLEVGYGLMGGGCGAYEFCSSDDCPYLAKRQDSEET